MGKIKIPVTLVVEASPTVPLPDVVSALELAQAVLGDYSARKDAAARLALAARR